MGSLRNISWSRQREIYITVILGWFVERYAYFSAKLVKNSLSKNSSIVVERLKRLIVVGRPTRLIVVGRLIRIFRPRQKTDP